MAGKSDFTMAFFLGLNDQLTPAINDAGSAYEQFTKNLSKWNAKANKLVDTGFAGLGKTVESFTVLPKTASKAYADTMTMFRKNVKPIKQPVELMFGKTQRGKNAADAIARGVAKLLSKGTYRFSASLPKEKSKFFDTSVPLTKLYRKVPQPPDMVGALKIPGYARGRGPATVSSGAGPMVDDNLAVLARHEMVTPADASQKILDIAGQARHIRTGDFQALPTDFTANLAKAENLIKAAVIHKEMHAANIDPKGMKKFNSSLREADGLFQKLIKDTDGYDKLWSGRMKRTLLDSYKSLHQMQTAAKDAAGPLERLFKKIMSPVQFIAISEAFHNISGSLRDLHGSIAESFGHSGAEPIIADFVENMNAMSRLWHLNAAGQAEFAAGLQADMKDFRLGVTNLGELSTTTRMLGEEFNLTSKDALTLAPAVEALSKASNVSTGAAGELGATLTKTFGASKAEVQDLFAGIAQTGSAATTATQTLNDLLRQNAGYFSALSPDKFKAVTTNTVKMVSALNTVNPELAKAFSDTLTDAFSGLKPEAMQSLYVLTGKTLPELKKGLEDGTVNLDTFGNNLQNLSDVSLKNLANNLGVSVEALTAAKNASVAFQGKGVSPLTQALADQNKQTVQTNTGMSVMNGIFKDSQTWAQGLITDISDLVTRSATLNYVWHTFSAIGPLLAVVANAFVIAANAEKAFIALSTFGSWIIGRQAIATGAATVATGLHTAAVVADTEAMTLNYSASAMMSASAGKQVIATTASTVATTTAAATTTSVIGRLFPTFAKWGANIVGLGKTIMWFGGTVLAFAARQILGFGLRLVGFGLRLAALDVSIASITAGITAFAGSAATLTGLAVGGTALAFFAAFALAIGSVVFLIRQLIVYWDDFMSIFNGKLFSDLMTIFSSKTGAITKDELRSGHIGKSGIGTAFGTALIGAVAGPGVAAASRFGDTSQVGSPVGTSAMVPPAKTVVEAPETSATVTASAPEPKTSGDIAVTAADPLSPVIAAHLATIARNTSPNNRPASQPANRSRGSTRDVIGSGGHQ